MFFEMDIDSLLYALSVSPAVLAILGMVWVCNAGGDGEL